MFTVIIAEKETIKLFEETKMFFGPLLNDEKIAFCEWDKQAESFESMVPGLYDITEFRKEWRAIVLNVDNRENLNPFDFTGYSEPFYSDKSKDWEYYKKRRLDRFASYEKAITNPLLKLTTALSGVPLFKTVIKDEELFKAVSSGEMELYEYMLASQLADLNCSEVAARYEKYQRDAFKRFVSEDKVSELIEAFKTADAKSIVGLVAPEDMEEFIRYIGQDPRFYDPEYSECMVENTKRAELLKALSEHFSMKDKLPQDIICLSPRTFDFETAEQDVKWKKRDENSYSRFAEHNLYSDKLKFILFDILPRDHRQYKFELVEFMCGLLMLANNPLPPGLVSSARVYRIDIDFDVDTIKRICEKYISKLSATQMHLREIEMQLDRESDKTVDDRTAHRLFESDITIPVKLVSSDSSMDIFAEYKGIGLSGDCPEHEDIYWSEQYRKINRNFTKYLREPRRAVKAAVSEGLRKNCTIEDDRSLLLSENQVEDVNYHLIEEEQKMIDTCTKNVFDTKKFYEQIQEADKELTRKIGQRMSRRKTVFVGIIAILAYLAGFLPLVFGNINSVKSFLFSLIITGIAVGAFALVGFVYLVVLRKRLINRFKHFNYTMGGIVSNVSLSLASFSKYLSAACNVMRDFSVLKNRESAATKVKKVFRFHKNKINEQKQSVHDMFSKYVDFSKIDVIECEPYDYDFTLMRNYTYEMPNIHSNKRIEFLQSGNFILAPVDYVESITLTREELYD